MVPTLTSGRRLILSAAAITGACVFCTVPTGYSEASWTSPADAKATVTAGHLNAVTTLACDASSGTLSSGVGFTWSAPSTADGGLAPTDYLVTWSGSAGTGQTTTTTTTASVTGSSFSLLGASTVTVYATDGAWESPASTPTRTITTVSVLGEIVDWDCS